MTNFSLRGLIDQAISLAHVAGEIVPGLEGGAQIAQHVEDLLAGLHKVAPDGQSADQIEAAHDALYKRVTDAGHTLSDRLRGEG